MSSEKYHNKSFEQLFSQLSDVENELNEPIDIHNFYKEDVKVIKDKYPERYEAYLKLLRAKKSKNPISKEEKEEMLTWITALNNLDDYLHKHHRQEKNKTLRDQQVNVFEDIRDSLEKGFKSGFIKLPTGVGKTVLFSQIAEAIGLKTLIIVPSKILVTQTGERLEQFTDLEYGKYFQESKDFSKQATITTYQSFIKLIESGQLKASDYGLLILDEAHKSLGPKTQQIVNNFDCIKLGFTATPKYSTDRHVNKILPHEIHSMSIIEAVRSGLINRFKNVRVETSVDLSSVNINQKGNYDNSQLEKAVNVHGRNMAAVELYKQAFSKSLAIAYCSGRNHAQALKELFQKNGITAEVIDGNTPPDERKIILENFSKGKVQVLCNARVLIEGFDESKASVCLNLHPTLSRVDTEQRGGEFCV